MSNLVFITTSLDGFIARKNGGIDWLNDIPNSENSDFGFNEFMKRIDAIVLGRNTFDLVLTFNYYPYIKQVFVLSSTLKSIPERLKSKVEILTGEPNKIVELLINRGYKNLYIDGGKTIQGFLRQELLDKIIITRIPILLGSSILLFNNLTNEQKFEHIETVVFNNALVRSHYKKLLK